MTPDFDKQRIIVEAESIIESAKSVEERQIPIVMPIQYVLYIATFLTAVKLGRKVNVMTRAVDSDTGETYRDDILEVLGKKFSDAVGETHKSTVYFDITRRDLDMLGELLVSKLNGDQTNVKNIDDIRKPVYSSYLILNWEFVNRGSLNNVDLTTKIASLVKGK